MNNADIANHLSSNLNKRPTLPARLVIVGAMAGIGISFHKVYFFHLSLLMYLVMALFQKLIIDSLGKIRISRKASLVTSAWGSYTLCSLLWSIAPLQTLQHSLIVTLGLLLIWIL